MPRQARRTARGKPARVAVLSPDASSAESVTPLNQSEDESHSSSSSSSSSASGSSSHSSSSSSNSSSSLSEESKTAAAVLNRVQHHHQRRNDSSSAEDYLPKRNIGQKKPATPKSSSSPRSKNAAASGYASDDESGPNEVVKEVLSGKRPLHSPDEVKSGSDATDEISGDKEKAERAENKIRKEQSKAMRRKAREKARTERNRQKRLLERAFDGGEVTRYERYNRTPTKNSVNHSNHTSHSNHSRNSQKVTVNSAPELPPYEPLVPLVNLLPMTPCLKVDILPLEPQYGHLHSDDELLDIDDSCDGTAAPAIISGSHTADETIVSPTVMDFDLISITPHYANEETDEIYSILSSNLRPSLELNENGAATRLRQQFLRVHAYSSESASETVPVPLTSTRHGNNNHIQSQSLNAPASQEQNNPRNHQPNEEKPSPSREKPVLSSNHRNRNHNHSHSHNHSSNSSESTKSSNSNRNANRPAAAASAASGAAVSGKNLCCHYCRISRSRESQRRKNVLHLSCSTCKNTYCASCCEHYMDVDFDKFYQEENWRCDVCLGTCCCCFETCTKSHHHCFTYRRTIKRHQEKPVKLSRKKKRQRDESSVSVEPRSRPSPPKAFSERSASESEDAGAYLLTNLHGAGDELPETLEKGTKHLEDSEFVYARVFYLVFAVFCSIETFFLVFLGSWCSNDISDEELFVNFLLQQAQK